MKPRIKAMIAHYIRSKDQELIYYEREFDPYDGGCFLNKDLFVRAQKLTTEEFVVFTKGTK